MNNYNRFEYNFNGRLDWIFKYISGYNDKVEMEVDSRHIIYFAELFWIIDFYFKGFLLDVFIFPTKFSHWNVIENFRSTYSRVYMNY